MKFPKVLRHQIDIMSVLTVVGVLALQVTALLLNWSWLLIFPLVLLLRQVNLVEHNHSHVKTFYNRTLNDALGWMCFLSNGVPLEFYEIHHVHSHHRFNNKIGDWSSMFDFDGCEYPSRPVSRGYYILTFPVLTITNSLSAIVRKAGSRIFRRFIRSMIIVTALSAALAYVNPLGFLAFFLVPWLLIFHGLGMTNYRHHVECEFTTPYNSSHVLLGLPYGLLGFHVGLHVSHHMKPGLHWSLLPAHHASIQHLIPAANYRPLSSRPADAPSLVETGSAHSVGASRVT